MATNIIQLTDDEIRVRYHEPYVSEGLNMKLFAVLPRGVYRGWRLAVDGLAGEGTVSVSADPDLGDHVLVYSDADGHALTIRREGGDFLIDLSALAADTYILAIYATYSVGADTEAFLRAYTQAQYDAASEKNYLVVLGRVVVPASGAIPVANITGTGRTVAGDYIARELTPWRDVVRCGDFEFGNIATQPDGVSVPRPFWQFNSSGSPALGDWALSETDPHGGIRCAAWSYVSMGANTAVLKQPLWVQVKQGDRIRVRFWYKTVSNETAGTSCTVTLSVTTLEASGVSSTETINSDVFVTDFSAGSWTLYDKVFEIADADTDVISGISFSVAQAADTTFAAGERFRLDDVHVLVEPPDPSFPQSQVRTDAGPIFATGLSILDASVPTPFSALSATASVLALGADQAADIRYYVGTTKTHIWDVAGTVEMTLSGSGLAVADQISVGATPATATALFRVPKQSVIIGVRDDGNTANLSVLSHLAGDIISVGANQAAAIQALVGSGKTFAVTVVATDILTVSSTGLSVGAALVQVGATVAAPTFGQAARSSGASETCTFAGQDSSVSTGTAGQVTLKGGAGTANDCSGGNVLIAGGAKNGTGKVGNVALHAVPASFGTNAEGVCSVGPVTTAPAGNPTSGYSVLWSDTTALHFRGSGGHIEDLVPAGNGTFNPTVIRRSGGLQTTDGSNNIVFSYTVATGSAIKYHFEAVGIRSDASEAAGLERVATIRNVAGALANAGANDTITQRDDATWALTTNFNVTTVEFRINGNAGDTVNWVWKIEILVTV